MPPKREKESSVSSSPIYELGSKVLCSHNDDHYYEAKIIGVDRNGIEPIYTVHYQGWNQRHDEKIPHSQTLTRFKAFTPENVDMAKKEMDSRQSNKTRKKNQRRNIKSHGGSGEDESTTTTGVGRRETTTITTTTTGGSRSSTPMHSISRGASIASEPIVNSSVVSGRKRRSEQPVSEPIKDLPLRRANQIRIELSLSLKEMLVDDGDLVNRQMKLPKVPARISAAQIIAQYGEEKKNDVLSESALGIRDYFDAALGTQLLYKFERPQYGDLIDGLNEDDRKQMSKYYGFIHLLRLFVRFGSMLACTQWSERSIKTIVSHMADFIAWADENSARYFDVDLDYETAAPEYQKRAWT